MGFWRTHYFRSRRGFVSDAQTEVYDLPKVGLLSHLCIEIELSPGATNQDIYFADAITKLEVIGNGSTVIKSYDGRQCQAIMAFDDGVMPPDTEQSPTGWGRGYFDIRFGRYPGDEKYALDCGAWESLELKFTYAVAAGGVIDDTGFWSGSGYLTIWGLYAPTGAAFSPVGYIKTEEKKTYTSVANTEYELDLPSDYPYRRLLLFTETHEISPSQGFQYVTINVNEGAKKPMDNFSGSDLLRWQAIVYKQNVFKHHKRYYLDNTTGNAIHSPLRYMTECYGICFAPNVIAYTTHDNTVFVITTSETSSWGTGEITIAGLCPWGALLIDLEKLSRGLDGVAAMQAAWDCTQADDIDLEFTTSVSAAALSVVLEQYVTK